MREDAMQAQAINEFPPVDEDPVQLRCQDTFGNQYTFRFLLVYELLL